MTMTRAEILWLVKHIATENLGITEFTFGDDAEDGQIRIKVNKPKNGTQVITADIVNARDDDRYTLQISVDYAMELISVRIHKQIDSVVMSTTDLKEE